MLQMPDFIEYGYKADPVSKSVKSQMMNQRVAPPELLNDIVCFCKDLSQEDCVCLHNEQPYTSFSVNAIQYQLQCMRADIIYIIAIRLFMP